MKCLSQKMLLGRIIIAQSNKRFSCIKKALVPHQLVDLPTLKQEYTDA